MKLKVVKKVLMLSFLALITQFGVNAQELIAGEIQSKTEYTYGKIEIRMFSEYVIGTTSTYFWWRNGGQECNYQWNEIDIETLPLFQQYQSNPIWQRYDGDIGSGGCNWLSEGRHGDKATVFGRWIVYTLEWCPNYIAWYHDGILDRRINRGSTTNDPVTYINKAMRYCFNLWTQGESPGWLGNLDWIALQNNPVYQYVDYFKYYPWNGTSFDATATKTINFDSDADITGNFNKSTWGMSQSKGHVQWDTSASGVSKLSDGNGVLWLGLAYKGQMHAPYATDLPPAANTTNVAVTGITLSSGTVALVTPATTQLIATVAPTNATNKTVLWKTSNAAVATVSATGLVSSVAAGTATITATTQDGAKVVSCIVTVTSPQVVTHTIPGIIEAEQYTANFGLTAEATTDTNGGQNLGYSDTNDYAYYTIDVLKTSNYTIDFRIASLTGGSGLSLSVDGVKVINDLPIAATGGWQVWNTLTNTIALTQGKHILRFDVVRPGFNINWIKLTDANIAVTGVALSSGTLSLKTPATSQLTATVVPANATNKTVFWKTSNAAVATVSATGLVSSIAAGTATITATSEDGAKVATCLVTVTSTVAATGVTLSSGTLSLKTPATSQLTATVVPANATNKTVFWKTSNAAIATVSATGLVSSIAAGTATITATSEDGAKVATCLVTVTSTVAVTGVSLSAVTLALATPATAQLTATVVPTNATNKTVTWTTSNPAVATVSALGLVSSVSAGTATITATTQDGVKVATCLATVTTTAAFNLKIEAELYTVMLGVQNQTTTDTGGGLNVGYIDTNDWMAYNNITIPTAGAYTVSYRIASLAGGGRLQLETNSGATILDPGFTIPSTGGWQNWQTVTRTVTLPAGTYNLGLSALTGGFNVNWFSITKSSNATFATTKPATVTNEIDSAKYFVMYPNPATSVLNLSVDTDWEFVNFSGAVLLKGKGKVIDVSTFPNGVYFVKTTMGMFRAAISRQ